MNCVILNSPAERWELVAGYLNATGTLRPEDRERCKPLLEMASVDAVSAECVQKAAAHYRKCETDYLNADREKADILKAVGADAILHTFGYETSMDGETDEMGNPLAEPDFSKPSPSKVELEYPIICSFWLQAGCDRLGSNIILAVKYTPLKGFIRV